MLLITLYKVSKVVKFIEQKVEWWLPEAGSRVWAKGVEVG